MSLPLVVLALWAAAAEPTRVGTQTMQEAYDQAFKLYQTGDFRKAIAKWNDILRADAGQSSAQRMIEQARVAMTEQVKAKRAKVYELIEQGQYKEALRHLQIVLDLDPTDSTSKKLENRLEQVSETLPETPAERSKAWRVAIGGLKGYLLLPQDLKLAHNGLRYAVELAPEVEQFSRLLALLRLEFPQLAVEDTVTPGMRLLEHKHLVALHHIYDARYHAAIPALREILQLEPDDVTALKRLGSAFFSLGRRAQAKEAWTKALRLAPKDPTLKEFLAKVQ